MLRVPKFKDVHVLPATGFRDRAWHTDRGEDPSEEAFARASRSVCELYSEALRDLQVDGLSGVFRLGCYVRDRMNVAVTVVPDKPWEGGEMGQIWIPPNIGSLTPVARARLVLNAIHGAVLQLAQIRGWDPSPFESCRRHVEESHFVYSRIGPWKTNPGRRWQARTTYQLPPGHGFGTCVLEIRAAGEADEAPIARSPEADAFCTDAGFRRSITTLRWTSKEEVSVTPYSGLLWDIHGLIRATRLDGIWQFNGQDQVIVRWPPRPGIAPADEQHEDLPDVVVSTAD